MRKEMFYGAGPLIFEKAKALRNTLTHAELVLWSYLKTSPMGLKFRRQHPTGIYIVDFYCHELKLVIEVDGKIHERIENRKDDEKRQKDLEDWGIEVVRFRNDEVELKLEEVINRIETILITKRKPL